MPFHAPHEKVRHLYSPLAKKDPNTKYLQVKAVWCPKLATSRVLSRRERGLWLRWLDVYVKQIFKNQGFGPLEEPTQYG